jgi:hypothetical protein
MEYSPEQDMLERASKHARVPCFFRSLPWKKPILSRDDRMKGKERIDITVSRDIRYFGTDWKFLTACVCGRLLALLPGEVHLLGEGDGGIVVCHLPGSGRVGGCQGNAAVDVEKAFGTARRPNSRGRWDLVLLGVDLALLPGTTTLDGGPGSGLSFRLVSNYCVFVSHKGY